VWLLAWDILRREMVLKKPIGLGRSLENTDRKTSIRDQVEGDICLRKRN